VHGRSWVFTGAILGGLWVVAGAVGAHALTSQPEFASSRIYQTGQLYHAIHALALVGVGLLLLQSERRATTFSSLSLQFAAAAFVFGIACFSGGIYLQILAGLTSIGKIVPIGGSSFIAGWAALGAGAISLRR
jgi:uncharacterized membrane protein YgdD (TMEM256/DUF423 family)